VTASDISDFVLRHGYRMAATSAHLMAAALRSFFRLFQRGDLSVDLAGSVPAVARWRLSTAPKHLTPEEVYRVLRTGHRRTTSSRRDYGILLLLARLGLRAGEVVALQLDDINWRAGEIIVRGKGLFRDRMPLLPDVGVLPSHALGVPALDFPAERSEGVNRAVAAPPPSAQLFGLVIPGIGAMAANFPAIR
jgi:integrase